MTATELLLRLAEARDCARGRAAKSGNPEHVEQYKALLGLFSQALDLAGPQGVHGFTLPVTSGRTVVQLLTDATALVDHRTPPKGVELRRWSKFVFSLQAAVTTEHKVEA